LPSSGPYASTASCGCGGAAGHVMLRGAPRVTGAAGTLALREPADARLGSAAVKDRKENQTNQTKKKKVNGQHSRTCAR
jgi:hypothetical protein